MKWSIGDRVLYEYRPDKGRFGGVDVDYYGEIVNIVNEAGTISVVIKFDHILSQCSYTMDHFVMQVLKLLSSKFNTNNPNKTFREKHVGK